MLSRVNSVIWCHSLNVCPSYKFTGGILMPSVMVLGAAQVMRVEPSGMELVPL